MKGDSCPESIAERDNQVAQAAELLGAACLDSLDLDPDPDHGPGRLLQHYAHLHLVTVAIVE